MSLLDYHIALTLHPMLTTGITLAGGARLAHRSGLRETLHQYAIAAQGKSLILGRLFLFLQFVERYIAALEAKRTPKGPASVFGLFTSLFAADCRTSHSFDLAIISSLLTLLLVLVAVSHLLGVEEPHVCKFHTPRLRGICSNCCLSTGPRLVCRLGPSIGGYYEGLQVLLPPGGEGRKSWSTLSVCPSQ